ncbi:MAG TPA: hypothetical protein PLH02_00430 [Bacillota bacterium]|nr:hypothetical protein [Bacillota bacterium]HPJ85374.1 hypothetical protein [Bacillota bacterium]HPQ61330.1 hypothetical protein [Bacillota bacterium]
MMDLEERYLECLDMENIEEKLDKSNELQNDSLLAKDWDHYVKATLAVSECQEMLADQESANQTLEEALKHNEMTDYKQIVSLIDSLVRGYLKTEEYEKLLPLLERRENYLEAKRSYKTMQKFYLAVCYEGLGDIKKAIFSLNDVEDTLSGANLASKYLKLSMLYLADGNGELARNALEKAAVFDPKEENPLFHLAKSDLSLFEGDDIKASEHYRKFFVISKNKNRYLDRFIRIAISQNNLEEAVRFDEKWRDKIDAFYSKHAKKNYYEAVLELYKKLGDFGKAGKLQEELQKMAGEKPPLVDIYEMQKRIFEDMKNIILPSSNRMILLSLCRSLFSSGLYSRLDFVYLKDDGYSVMHYSKGLLLESFLTALETENTLIDKVMSEDDLHQVFQETDLGNMKAYRKSEDDEIHEVVIAMRVENESYKKGCFLAYPKSLGIYETANNILKTAVMALEAKIRSNDECLEAKTQEKVYIEALERAGYGMLRIEGDTVKLYDEAVKSILGQTKDYLSFDEFIGNATTEKRLFPDDFMVTEKMTLKYNVSGNVRTLQFINKTSSLAIECLVKDMTDKLIQDTENKEASFSGEYYMMPGMSGLAKANNGPFKQKSYLVVNFQNMDEVYSLPDETVPARLAVRFKDMAEKSARSRLLGLYALSSSSFVLLLETNDKRMIERIARELRSIDYQEILYPVMQISTNALVINRPTDFKVIRRQLLEMSVSRNEEENVLYTSRQRSFSDELSVSILEATNRILAEGALSLEYHPIGRWQEKKIFWLEAALNSRSLFGSKEQLDLALVGFNKVREYQNAFSKRFVKDVKYFLKKNDSGTVFLYPIEKYLLMRPEMISYLIRETNKAKIDPQRIIFMIKSPFSSRKKLAEVKKSITEGGYSFAFSEWLNDATGNDLPLMREAVFGVISSEEFDKTVPEWYHVCQQAYSHGIVFDHQARPLKKSFLSENKIEYVMGEYYPAIDIRQLAD